MNSTWSLPANSFFISSRIGHISLQGIHSLDPRSIIFGTPVLATAGLVAGAGSAAVEADWLIDIPITATIAATTSPIKASLPALLMGDAPLFHVLFVQPTSNHRPTASPTTIHVAKLVP